MYISCWIARHRERLMETLYLTADYDCLAPDGSEIRLLVKNSRGSCVHCTLPARGLSAPVAHRYVEEIWYCLEGTGQVWRLGDKGDDIVEVRPGISLTIPAETPFQFRNAGEKSLCFLITTMPPWPGEKEAYHVEGYWHLNPEQDGR